MKEKHTGPQQSTVIYPCYFRQLTLLKFRCASTISVSPALSHRGLRGIKKAMVMCHTLHNAQLVKTLIRISSSPEPEDLNKRDSFAILGAAHLAIRVSETRP